MNEANGEQKLGGRTALSVVRIGDTVRRTPALNDEFARAVLLHLAQQEFDGAPRFLGIDSANRRIFSCLIGEVPGDLRRFDDQTIVTAARLIRRYHDATASLFAGAAWRRVGMEVACHNDLSPCNTVFQGGEPIALIDFDAAAPGTRAWDFGYAAWLWLDLGNQKYSATEQLRRLTLFVDAYGSPLAVKQVALAAIGRQELLKAEAARLGKSDMATWASSCNLATCNLVELLP